MRMKDLKITAPAIIVIVLLATACNPPLPSEQQAPFPPTKQLREDGPMEAYSNMLRKRVNRKGDVHYAGIQADDAALRGYLRYMGERHVLLQKAPPPEQLAYWINVYNAGAIMLVVGHYPIRSVLEVDLDFDATIGIDYVALNDTHPEHPFDKAFIKLADRMYSLNEIRNEVIRKQFADPRVHFALVDGTASAPRLRRELYTKDNLEERLELATREFLSTPMKNVLNPNEPRISQLFERYATDFGPDEQGVITFINRYIPVELNPDAEITYVAYDWRLNGY